MQIDDKDKIAVAISAAKNARDSCAGNSDRQQRITFQYIGILSAIAFASATDAISASVTTVEKVFLAALPSSIMFIGCMSVLLHARQIKIVHTALIEIERALECYKVGAYEEDKTLLPLEWANHDNKYVGTRQHYPHIITMTVLTVVSVTLILF